MRRGDTAHLRFHSPIQDTGIEFDGSERTEGAKRLFVQFVGVSDFGDGADNVVGMEFGFRFDAVITGMVQSELTKRACLERSLADPVADGVAHAQGFQQRGVLLWCSMQFDNRTDVHTVLYHLSQTKAIVWTPRKAG